MYFFSVTDGLVSLRSLMCRDEQRILALVEDPYHATLVFCDSRDAYDVLCQLTAGGRRLSPHEAQV